MAKGLPKSIIKKYGITKKAWDVFRGRRSSKSRKRKANKPSRTRYVRRKTYMARKRKSRTRSFLSFNTFAKFIKIGALVGPAAYCAMLPATPKDKLAFGLKRYTGFDLNSGSFAPEWLLQGWGPYILTSLVVTGIGKLNGIIRRL